MNICVFRISYNRGATFSLAINAYTMGNGETKFFNFFPMSKENCLVKGGHGSINAPSEGISKKLTQHGVMVL